MTDLEITEVLSILSELRDILHVPEGEDILKHAKIVAEYAWHYADMLEEDS